MEPSLGVSPEQVPSPAGQDASLREAWGVVCIAAERASVARLNVRALRNWIDAHARLVDGLSAPEALLGLDLARGWSRLIAGDVDGLVEQATAIESAASKARIAPMVIEAASLGAMAALARGELGAATAVARRASRMARTEALPQQEYLAHLVLARLRRFSGRAHLALRIVGALGRIASPQWRGWIAWESLLAGGIEEARIVLDADEEASVASAASAAARALMAVVEGASAGRRDVLEQGAQAAREALSGCAPWQWELEDALVAVDPDRLEGGSAAVAAWACGDGALPGWLSGVAGLARLPPEAASIYVLARPGGGSRRLIELGLPLVAGPTSELGTETGPLRTRKAAALLLLAGPAGAVRETFFRSVYGFAFAPVIHQGVLDVLLHRVRAYLGDAVEMSRSGDVIAIEVRRALLVPEEDAERPLDDRILRALATRGGGSAREAAEFLGVPLRTVQSALRELVDEGECVAHRQGRQIHYRVEDTTFSEPTRH